MRTADHVDVHTSRPASASALSTSAVVRMPGRPLPSSISRFVVLWSSLSGLNAFVRHCACARTVAVEVKRTRHKSPPSGVRKEAVLRHLRVTRLSSMVAQGLLLNSSEVASANAYTSVRPELHEGVPTHSIQTIRQA